MMNSAPVSSHASAPSANAQPVQRQHRSEGGGHGKHEMRAQFNDQLSSLKSDYKTARREAAGDPALMDQLKATFQEKKSELKTQFQARQDHLRGASGPSVEAPDDPIVASDPVVPDDSGKGGDDEFVAGVPSSNSFDVVA